MAERHGIAFWPGVRSVMSCSYTTSHGVTPGTALLRCHAQAEPPAERGTLTLTDGLGTVVVPDCKLERLTQETGASGRFWTLCISDRRWKWRDAGVISGAYNQLDPHGKLLPWSIRSPAELAALCLNAFGETGYVIDLPGGLTSAAGAGLSRELRVGENFAPSGTNPPVNWDAETPAQALANLAEQYNCRVVYRLATNTVYVGPYGKGNQLPGGSLAGDSPSLTAPATPSAVAVVGAPTRYQCRFTLEAVGLEWDGSYRPIDLLSYAPFAVATTPGTPAGVQVTHASIWKTPAGSWQMGFVIGKAATTVNAIDGAPTPTNIATALADAVNANEFLSARITATSSLGTVILTAKTPNLPFGVTLRGPDESASVVEIVQAAVPANGAAFGAPSVSWAYSGPPLFVGAVGGAAMPGGVRATNRLTVDQALQLARQSVFRCYRIKDVNVTGRGPITVPGYGPLLRRQQVLLENSQVDQIVPTALDLALVNIQTGRAYIQSLYDGYSRDKPAVVFGSVCRFCVQTTTWSAVKGLNTPEGSQVFVGFTVDPVNQLVVFSSAVYRLDGGRTLPAELVLQTGCQVRDPETNQVVRYYRARPLAGGAPDANIVARRYEDVQLNVTATYDDKNRVTSVRPLEADPFARSDYYLAGMAEQYRVVAGSTRRYNGLVAVDLDGAIEQITWEVGGSGASTTASRTSEHSVAIPPYPARRRAENLRPAQQGALQAVISPPRSDMGKPKGAS